MSDSQTNETKESTAQLYIFMRMYIVEEIKAKCVDDDEAEEVATEIINKIRHACGGSTVYMSRGISEDAAIKHSKILQELRGNYQEIARKYGVTSNWIRKIERRAINAKMKKSQPDMFGSDHE